MDAVESEASYDDWPSPSPSRSSFFSPSPPPSPFSAEIASLTARLDSLAASAQSILSQQPRKTQHALTKATRDIFTKYETHGSAARLSHNLMQFLQEGAGPDLDLRKTHPAPIPHLTPTPRTIDEESRGLVPDSALPFHPIDTLLSYPHSNPLPASLLQALDVIFALHSHEAHNLLKHHIARYGAHPLFRAGIRALLASRLESIFLHANDDDLGMTPETRTFLRSVFEQTPEINLGERRMLARVCRVTERSIGMFWEDLHERRRAWFAMRVFVAAREVEANRAGD
jgi:hypothetical protein